MSAPDSVLGTINTTRNISSYFPVDFLAFRPFQTTLMRMSRSAEKWPPKRVSTSRRTIFVLSSVGLMLFRFVSYLFSLRVGCFFGVDWRRELVVRGVHVLTVFRFSFLYVVLFVPCSWYGTSACDGRVLYPSKTSTHVTWRHNKLDR